MALTWHERGRLADQPVGQADLDADGSISVRELHPAPRLRTLSFDVFEWACLALGSDGSSSVDPEEVLSGASQAELPPAPTAQTAGAFLGAVLENADAYDLGQMRADEREVIGGIIAGHFWMEVSREVARYQAYKQHLAARHPQVPPADGSISAEGGRRTLRMELSRLDPLQYDALCRRWPLSEVLIYMELVRVRRFLDDVEEAVKKALRSLPLPGRTHHN